MFQSFKIHSNRDDGPERLNALQKEMKNHDVTHFLVPHADEHQNEYLPECAERLAWLTGFTGSAGFAIATPSSCTVFVDGRYTLQAAEQVHPDAFAIESLITKPPSKWLEENTSSADVIAYDPWLITGNQLEAYEKAAEASGAVLRPSENLVDKVWSDRPPAPSGEVFVHPLEFAGKQASEKIEEIQTLIKEKEADYALLTDPASLAWLFNIRGSDMVHNPLPLGYALVPVNDSPLIFMESAKINEEAKEHLEVVASLLSPNKLLSTLEKHSPEKAFLCDYNLVSVALIKCITEAGGEIVKGRDPVSLPRSIKNSTEISGTRAAHVRDGVAMCRFLCWLDHQNPAETDEISVAKKLEEMRSETAKTLQVPLKEISFDTISGHGPNGAIVHYRVNEASNRTFTDNSLYLVDSGGQYQDGTTDITRTVAIGTPPDSAIKDFTLVLKGHIALSMARFPENTRGVDLDVLARIALWQTGRDYAHGTGHGVGSYLNVHEGPQNISKRGMEPLVPGMIISNEPGYYVEGEYGIRIENLVLVEEAETMNDGNVATHGFETLTLAPIDLRLVDASIMNDTERDWLNTYHKRVRETVFEHLQEDEQAWLEVATREI